MQPSGSDHDESPELPGGEIGDTVGCWTYLGKALGGEAIFEDFTRLAGEIRIVRPDSSQLRFPKSAEPTFAEPESLYRGHSLAEVRESDHDLLGAEVLELFEDPSFKIVAPCLAPIAKMETYTFVGTRHCPDKVGLTYGGRSPTFDPAVYVPRIREIREAGGVLDGLVGGWLPAVRFVYPEEEGTWSEMIAFAPFRRANGNPNFQPVWYRVCRVEEGQLKWAKYFDSFHPSALSEERPRPEPFYSDFLEFQSCWDQALEGAMTVDLPDQRLADLARHSLVRAMITRNGAFPKYGVMDRNYGGAEHDGFQDTFNIETSAMLAWGLFDLAREYIDNYFENFVRDDGSILYRGSETGQFGRMLTVVSEYQALTGDRTILSRHRKRIDAIAQMLVRRCREARKRQADDSAYGVIDGWCEADSCLEPDPGRYLLPYFSNSAEAARGLRDLGATWGHEMRAEAERLRADLIEAIERSTLPTVPACIPAIAGAGEPLDPNSPPDAQDPSFRAYRAYSELLFSGVLDRRHVETILKYREARRDILLGVPAVYGYNSGEMGGFLAHGHAYGLIQHDFVREFLLTLCSLSAHQYTRGTWTAPETRRIDAAVSAAPYCSPAQLTVPLLLRWMLAFEDPNAEVLCLGKAVPRDWLSDGKVVAAKDVPTRWGKVSFRIESSLESGSILVLLDLSATRELPELVVRLRTPGHREIASVEIDGVAWSGFDTLDETIRLAHPDSRELVVRVRYQ